MLTQREHETLVHIARAPGEHRRSKRQPFPHAQLVAIWKTPNGLPFLLQESLACRDLSTTGIGLFWHARPEFSTVLLGLDDDHTIFVMARVVRYNQGYWDGVRRYLVGCEFTQRIPAEIVQQWIDDGAGRASNPTEGRVKGEG